METVVFRFQFYGSECQSFARTCHSCWPKQAFRNDLSNQKLWLWSWWSSRNASRAPTTQL